ncbi:secretory phospholipase A2 receptor-like [Gymnodraco acuticeps]|uniref:Secretory phospholipase A2 receptor-like n=1 Tax=Gymnodraco acuticeps TaxID=8218 RepID=A0A6P8SQF7_GYMAC|nr:secretory phospholipase A2 receptor-like [Gymnodraco acuticeps]
MDKTGLVILLLLALSTLSWSVTRKYTYFMMQKNWQEAQSYCRENSGDLATFESEEEWERGKQVFEITPGAYVWIGMYSDNRAWKWSIDNTSLYGEDGNTQLGVWFDLEIKNHIGKQICVEITSGTLHIQPCGELLRSVCYDEPNNTYIPVTVPMTWSSAQSYCREKYTDLTSMKTQQEKEEILKVTNESTWWIGLSAHLWNWSDRSNVSIMKWFGTEPNGGDSQHYSQIGWADAYCSDKMGFICSVTVIKLLKVELQFEASLDLTDPSVQEDVRNEMEKHLRVNGIHEEFTLRWRKHPTRKVSEKKGEP